VPALKLLGSTAMAGDTSTQMAPSATAIRWRNAYLRSDWRGAAVTSPSLQRLSSEIPKLSWKLKNVASSVRHWTPEAKLDETYGCPDHRLRRTVMPPRDGE
jgi:hypothetical protein